MTLKVNSIEILGGEVALSLDAESAVPVEIVLRGTDMQYVNSVEIYSGDDVAWVVSDISAGATSVLVTAYAFGTSAGSGFVEANVNDETVWLGDVGFAFPLID